MNRRLGRLRIVAIATGAVVAVAAAGTVAGVEVVAHQPPAKPRVAQVVAKVRASLVTVRVNVYRDGVAEGQGFLFGGGGHVLTSTHVLAHATAVKVVNARGETGSAAVVGVDRALDIAELLTSDRKTAPLVPASGPVAVGTKVMAVGNNYSALPYTVLTGTVEGLDGHVALKPQPLTDLIRTDIGVVDAGSGGPIVDMSGRLVGIVIPGDGGHALALPPARYGGEAAGWARTNNLVHLGPPMVDKSASSLVLAGVPLDGFAEVKSEAWAGTGIHVVYIRPPTYEYGSGAIDVYIDVEVQESDARALFSVGHSKDSGFLEVASGMAWGDQLVFLQRNLSTEVSYEVAWRDRNVDVYMYLSSGKPPAPDISLQTLIGLAMEQERPIEANLADW